jgi:hemoglobin-like flavoprotein
VRRAGALAELAVLPAKHIELVQSTWKTVLLIENEAARLFYARLFELDPDLRQLFKAGDLREQGLKLTAMITAAVNGLNRLDTIVPAVQALGRRHANYGVTDAHYETVAAALVWTLDQGLGDSFTPEVREAWVGVYGILAKTMKEAAALAEA